MSYMKMSYSENSTDLGLVEKAAAAFQKSSQLNPNMPEVSFQLGLAYLALDDKPGADRQYQALLPTSKTLADQLAVKIAAYKKPVSSQYLYNENNISGDQQEAFQDLVKKRIKQEQRMHEAELMEKQRLIDAVENARDAALRAESAANAAAAEASSIATENFLLNH